MRGMRIKYRIGVMPGPWTTNGDGVDLFWRFIDQCETSDIDSVWFSERLTSPQPVLEPMTTMAAVAARTRRLKFGPSVLIAPFRSPVLLARELAMLDYLSHGRRRPAGGRAVPPDHFGVLLYFGFAADRAAARAVAAPFIPRNRADDATLDKSAAFGPPEVLIERLEEYIDGGASKFILRPMVPIDQM